jgi:hypothetical protein
VFHIPQIAAVETPDNAAAAQGLPQDQLYNKLDDSDMFHAFSAGADLDRTVSQSFLGSLAGAKKEEEFIAPSSTMLNQPNTPHGPFRQPLSQERGTAQQEDFDMRSAGPLATPSTANAISSLAYMQILAHAQVQAAPSTSRSARIPATPLDATLGQDQQQEALDLLMNVKQEGPDYQGVGYVPGSDIGINDIPSSASRQNFDMQAIEAC